VIVSTTIPAGFRAAGVEAGQRAGKGADLALVVNDGPAIAAAAVFTSNRFQAAPVQWSRRVMASGATPRAVVLNSGGANACTGRIGMAQASTTAVAAAKALDLLPEQVLLGSTGLIGRPLALDKLLDGVDDAVTKLDASGWADAARAIMTTDTHPKTAAYQGDGWSVAGMAKGAGMIAPGMATLLVLVTTDAVTDNATAQRLLADAAEITFNRIDVDGCMSTNDTLILMASGASAITPDEGELAGALTSVCQSLALQCIGDAEGASHEIAITVQGATSQAAALAVARAIGRSNLFKCAVYGDDPNWGRILSAAGTVPDDVAPFYPNRVDVAINGVVVCRDGAPGDPRELVDMASHRHVDVVVDLHAGVQQATIQTNDLTYDYVKENAEYST